MQKLKGAYSESYTILSGETQEHKYSGEFVRCLESNGALEISFNRGGGRSFFSAGIARRAPNNSIFQSFEIHNKGDAPIDYTVGWGFGDIEDNRLQATGDTVVVNKAGDEFEVTDATTHSKIDDLITQLQKDYTEWESDLSYYSEVGTKNETIVSAGANVGGVLIRHAQIYLWLESNGQLLIDDVEILGNRLADNSNASAQIENILIPAGKKISTQLANRNAKLNMVYKVL